MSQHSSVSYRVEIAARRWLLVVASYALFIYAARIIGRFDALVDLDEASLSMGFPVLFFLLVPTAIAVKERGLLGLLSLVVVPAACLGLSALLIFMIYGGGDLPDASFVATLLLPAFVIVFPKRHPSSQTASSSPPGDRVESGPNVNAGGILPKPEVRKQIVRTLIYMVTAVIVAVVSLGHSTILHVQNVARQIDKTVTEIHQFRDKSGGIAIGCATQGVSSSAVAGSPNGILGELSESYRKSAKATGDLLISEGQYIDVKWPKTPWEVAILPWFNDRYLRLRRDADAHITWAKRELADHSCAKRQ